jgi:zinc transporter ZupT
MKTDVFTLTFVLAIVVAVIAGGVVFIVAQNNLTDIP